MYYTLYNNVLYFVLCIIYYTVYYTHCIIDLFELTEK